MRFLMRFLCQNRGSVLMEFLIVFPVYLVLLAGTYMIGDLLIKTIRLSSEERLDAFENQGGESAAARSKYYADTRVEGAWSLRSAVKVTGKYSLPNIGIAGQLDFTDQTLPGERATGDFAKLIHGEEIKVYSRSITERDGSPRKRIYNYYTLRRDKPAAGASLSWRDNRRYSSDLVARRSNRSHNWQNQVYDEHFHSEVNDSANRGNGPPKAGTVADDYVRYQTYINWSD